MADGRGLGIGSGGDHGATEAECKELIGRFGRSFEKRRSVDALIREAFPVTLSLSLLAAVIWLAVSIPVGVLSALRPRSIGDRVTTAAGHASHSIIDVTPTADGEAEAQAA